MCMHAQEVLFSNKIYKKHVTFFKNGRKKLFSLQNVIKKLFEMHYSLEKNCLQVPKMVTPSPPIKNNGPSLTTYMKKDFKNLKELRENGKLKAKGFARAPMEPLGATA